MTAWRTLRREYAEQVQKALDAARRWAVDRRGVPPPPPSPPPRWSDMGVGGESRRCSRHNAMCMALWRGSMRQWQRIVGSQTEADR